MTDTSSEAWKMECLARHVAHWNSARRESWLNNTWKNHHGEASTQALKIQVDAERVKLVAEHEKKREASKRAASKAMEECRRAVA